MFLFGKPKVKEEFSYPKERIEIDNMIKEIAKGVLGKLEKDASCDLFNNDYIDRLYVYENESVRIEYHESGVIYNNTTKGDLLGGYGGSCNFYVDGKLVYPSEVIDQSVIGRLRGIYKHHLEQTKKVIEERELKKYRDQRKGEVIKIFEFVYPNGYSDDKINITNLKRIKHSSYSSEEGCDIHTYQYKGRISLLNGTVVCDTVNDIYHPGMWEDYVISLAEDFKEEKERTQREMVEKARASRQRKRDLDRIIYELNHTPIDDSDIFKR